jgi:hypothetical protein
MQDSLSAKHQKDYRRDAEDAEKNHDYFTAKAQGTPRKIIPKEDKFFLLEP